MTLVGWCPGGRPVADMLARYPGTSAVRIFFGPGDGLPASAWTDPRQELSQVPPGAVAVVSHKDLGVDAAAFVDAWLTHRPDVDLDLIAHHEPEQQEGGDPTPTQFRASWTRQRQQVGGHPARAAGRLKLAVCYTLQWIRAGGDWRTWYPAHEAGAVDLVLFDSYQYEPGAPNPFRPRSYEEPASALAKMLEIAQATGKPWGIAEVDHLRITKANGFAVDLDPTGEMCAAWYRRMFAAAKAAGCLVWCHFHRGHGDLTSRLPEQQALRELIEQEASMTRVKSLGGHPIEQYDSPNKGGTMTGHKGVVLHIAEGTYRGTISWQMNPDQRYASGGSVTTSSTFIVGREPGEWAQMVDADRIAWCQRGGSYDWLSIELAGYAPNPPTAWQIEACAQLLAWANRTYGVPIQATSSTVTRGLGHHSMDNDTTVEWGHDSCPGAGVIAAKAAVVARAKQIINGEDDDDMDQATFDQRLLGALSGKGEDAKGVQAIIRALPWQYPVTPTTSALNALFAQQLPQLAAGVKALGELVARESSSPDEVRALLAGLPQPSPPVDVDEFAGSVAERVLAGLPTSDGPVSVDVLKAALRDVLGSLNDAPQG